jgi:hypothetical protein
VLEVPDADGEIPNDAERVIMAVLVLVPTPSGRSSEGPSKWVSSLRGQGLQIF